VVSNRRSQFAVEMTQKLNKMLKIETKLLMVFHSQINGQTEQINQELEQYLRFFVDCRQKNWPEWLALVEFVVNNKVHSAIKISPFMANYGKELRIRADIERKEKIEKTTEFAKKIKKIQEEVGTVLRKVWKR